MATKVLVDPFFSLGGVDLSEHVTQCSIEYRAEILDATDGGSGGTRANVAGLKDWTATVTLNIEYGAGEVEETLWNAVGVSKALEIRPDQDAASATNPKYTAAGALIEGFMPLQGNVGEIIRTSITVRPGDSGSNVLTRAIA